MPQDAFTIKYIVKELKPLLTGGKISKIIQPSKDLLSFIIYTRKGSLKLEICLAAKGCRINISNSESSAPKTAPGFCMLLRKHLQNAEITDVSQAEGERIVFIDFLCTSEFERMNMRLCVELMGKYSNAILTKDGIISGALKTTAIGESTKRILFTGAKYVLPEPQDKADFGNLSALKKLILTGDTAKEIADKVKGVSYATACEIAEEFGGKPSAEDIYGYLNGPTISPCVTYAGGIESDFKVRSNMSEKKPYPTILEAQTAYYAAVCAAKDFENKKRKLSTVLLSQIKKYEKRLAAEEQKLFDCRDMETVKLKGELITANIYAVQRGMDSFEAVNYYDEKCGTIKIALEKSLSPADNAQRYYKRYAKLKRTVTSVSAQRQETNEKLDYLYSINAHICAAEDLSDLEETEEELKILGFIKEEKAQKTAQKNTSFRSFYIDGFKVLAGRNNISNERLLKSVSPRDIWLHTQKYHSSHVVICAEEKEVPDNVLKCAAEICAYYSYGRNGTKIPVDYTRRTNVKKPPKSAAGFVIYTDYKTILVDPDGHTELKKD